MRVECAWCGVVLSEVQSGSGPVSHGICPSCSITMERAYFKSRIAAQQKRKTKHRLRHRAATLPLPGFSASGLA